MAHDFPPEIRPAFTKFKAILDATKEGKSYDEIK